MDLLIRNSCSYLERQLNVGEYCNVLPHKNPVMVAFVLKISIKKK